jgi:hypothetical protein
MINNFKKRRGEHGKCLVSNDLDSVSVIVHSTYFLKSSISSGNSTLLFPFSSTTFLDSLISLSGISSDTYSAKRFLNYVKVRYPLPSLSNFLKILVTKTSTSSSSGRYESLPLS